MRRWGTTSRPVGWGAVVLAVLTGCAAPPVDDAAGERIAGGVFLRPTPLGAGDPRQAEWFPVVGRMGDYVRTRHLPPDLGDRTVFVEHFDGATTEQVPHWRIFGQPELKPVRLDGLAGLEIRAPHETFDISGLERDLQPEILRGRDVRLELTLTCRSSLRAEALKGVNLSLQTVDQAGEIHTLALPVEADVAPGWETIRWWLRFDPTLRSAVLRIDLVRPGAAITLQGLRIMARDALSTWSLAGRPGPQAPASRPAGRVRNLIVDGDFEAGQRRFHASALQHWPNGEALRVPLGWQFDEPGLTGARALRLSIPGDGGRIGLGPLDLNPPPSPAPPAAVLWHLSFNGRATRQVTVSISLRTAYHTIDQKKFVLTSEWARFAGVFTVIARTFEERVEIKSAELLLDFAGDGWPDPNSCWLDGVALTDAPLDESSTPPAGVALGIHGPNSDPSDVAHVVDENEPMAFTIRLAVEGRKPTAGGASAAGGSTRPVGEAPATRSSRGEPSPSVAGPTPPIGRLAIDLVDAWDRAIWTKTTPAVAPVGGVYEDAVQIKLPRGYYRVLASLWSGEPGQSAMMAASAQAFAVIAYQDPVPTGNVFGLSADGGNVSLHTTHLGAGWVRLDLPSRRLQVASEQWDFSLWESVVRRCEAGGVEYVAGVTLPTAVLPCRRFLEQWFAKDVMPPIGIVLNPPSIAKRPDEQYFDLLAMVRDTLGPHSRAVTLVRDLSMLNPGGATPTDVAQALVTDAVGAACPPTPLPEGAEPALADIRDRRPSEAELWDLYVPIAIGGAVSPSLVTPLRAAQNNGQGPVRLLPEPLDPVRSASRMVRSLLIRSLAGARMVCCGAVALSPAASIYDDDQSCMHERDLCPRVALVAFEVMCSLLNDACLTRWIDVPGGSRVLCFEKDDGRTVAVAWRPFGLSPTRLALAELPPASVEVLDCTGVPVPAVFEANQRIIEVNEFVQYIIAPRGLRDGLTRALDDLKVRLPTATQPAR